MARASPLELFVEWAQFFCEQSMRYFERSAVAKDATRLSDLAVAKQSLLQGPKSAQ